VNMSENDTEGFGVGPPPSTVLASAKTCRTVSPSAGTCQWV
jgi:hypothetical protein